MLAASGQLSPEVGGPNIAQAGDIDPNTTAAQSVGIARAKNGDVTPAGEKLCAAIRKVA